MRAPAAVCGATASRTQHAPRRPVPAAATPARVAALPAVAAAAARVAALGWSRGVGWVCWAVQEGCGCWLMFFRSGKRTFGKPTERGTHKRCCSETVNLKKHQQNKSKKRKNGAKWKTGNVQWTRRPLPPHLQLPIVMRTSEIRTHTSRAQLASSQSLSQTCVCLSLCCAAVCVVHMHIARDRREKEKKRKEKSERGVGLTSSMRT